MFLNEITENLKYMPTIIGLVYKCTDASWKALSKQLKFERIFFPACL